MQEHAAECGNSSGAVEGKNDSTDKWIVNRSTTVVSGAQKKKQNLHTSGSPEGVVVERCSTKRSQEQPEGGERSGNMSTAAGASAETEPRAANGNTTEDTETDSAMEHVDTDLNTDMETNLMERMFQDDMKWTLEPC